MLAWKKSCDKPRWHIQKQRHHFADKYLYSQGYGFSSNHVRMWKLDYKKGWALKNWCFQTVVLEKTLESLLDIKEINTEYSLEGLMLKLKLHYFGHPIWRVDSLEKTDAGKDWRQEETGTKEDEMVGWSHWLNRHEFEQTQGKYWMTGKPSVLQFMGSQRVRETT